MRKFPADGQLPEIWLFESPAELRECLGHASSYGAYFPEENRIYALESSLAHEVAHFKDHKSGRMKNPRELPDPKSRRKARLRNEIVAILYSWQKTAQVENLKAHEKSFLEWFYFLLENKKLTLPKDEFENLHFSELQEIAERLVTESSEWSIQLEVFFEHYLRLESTDPYPKAL